MSTTTTNLHLIDLTYGETSAGGYTNWGDLTDGNLAILEDALTESQSISLSSTDVTMNEAQQLATFLILSGTLTANVNLVSGASRKGWWFVINNTTGSYTVTMKPSGGTGVTVTQSKRSTIYTDGSTAYKITEASSDFVSGSLVKIMDYSIPGGSSSYQIGPLTADAYRTVVFEYQNIISAVAQPDESILVGTSTDGSTYADTWRWGATSRTWGAAVQAVGNTSTFKQCAGRVEFRGMTQTSVATAAFNMGSIRAASTSSMVQDDPSSEGMRTAASADLYVWIASANGANINSGTVTLWGYVA